MNPKGVPDGEYVIYSSLGSGWERVVDVDNGEFKSCQNIQSWEPNGTAAQKYYIQHAWGDWYYIRVAADTTYVLDVLNGGKLKANIGIYPFHGGDNQLWKFVFTGKYQNGYPCCLIVSKSGGYCLDVCGASLDLGANIQAYDRNDTAAQIFTLHPTNANYDPQIHIQSTDYWGKYSYCKGYTLKESGCGVFALVNALEYVTGHNFSNDEIRDVAQFAIDRGYRVAGNGTSKQLAVGYAEAYGNQYGFKVGTTYYYNSKTSENQKTIEAFNSVLDKGGAIYLSVTSSSGGHIVSIVDKRINNGKTEYLLVDSYPSANRLGSGVSSGYVTIDNQLDLHAIGNGKKIVTKGSLGYYTILPK